MLLLALLSPAFGGENVVEPLSSRHLLVHEGERADFPRDPGGWTVTCGGTSVAVRGVAVKAKASALIPEGWPYPAVVAHDVVLTTDALTGTCHVTDGTVSGDVPMDGSVRSPTLKVSQVGFRPGDAAHAYASFWAPDTTISLEGQPWHVEDAGGDTVASGTFTLRLAASGQEDAYGNDFALADVDEAGLGALPDGTYTLVADGVGRTVPFRVGADVWDEPFRTVFRAHYLQRCGTALDPSLTEFSHGACHTAPVHLTDLDYYATSDPFTDLPAHDTGKTLSAAGGYHDAGDYDKRTDSLVVVDELLDLYETDPVKFAWDDAGIPESGNGVPDLVDEATWALTLYTVLQGDDGGVRAGIETTAYPGYDVMPDEDTSTTWYAYAEDAVSSYRFAARAAKLGRIVASTDPDASAAWLSKAAKAFAWAEANPGGHDVAVISVQAAVELYRATGETTYEDVMKARAPFATSGWTLQDWDGDDWDETLYVAASTDALDPDLRTAAESAFLARADSWVGWGQKSGYRFVKHPYSGINSGALSTPRAAADVLLRAYTLTGDQRYLEWAVASDEYAVGANPLGLSWVTGVGPESVRGVLSTPAIADGIDDPIPGIPLYGPSQTTESGGILGSVLAVYEPPADQWPIAERYADVTYAPQLNEYTVQESIAPTTFAFGYLAELADDGQDAGGDTADTDRPPKPGSERAKACGCASQPAAGQLAWPALALAVVTRRGRRRARPATLRRTS